MVKKQDSQKTKDDSHEQKQNARNPQALIKAQKRKKVSARRVYFASESVKSVASKTRAASSRD